METGPIFEWALGLIAEGREQVEIPNVQEDRVYETDGAEEQQPLDMHRTTMAKTHGKKNLQKRKML